MFAIFSRIYDTYTYVQQSRAHPVKPHVITCHSVVHKRDYMNGMCGHSNTLTTKNMKKTSTHMHVNIPVIHALQPSPMPLSGGYGYTS